VRSGRGPVRHTLLLLAPAGDGHPGVRNRSGCICGCIRPRSARPGSGHARAYDLPILLGWSSLIAGSTTLKASVPRGTGIRIPPLRLPVSSINAEQDDHLPVSVLTRGCIPGCNWAVLCLRLDHHWVRVRRAWLGRLAGATYQQRRGQSRARDQAEPAGHRCTSLRRRWRDAVPMLLGEEGIA
jgi:hypothetical protein